MKNYLVEKINLTKLTEFCNNNFKKQSGKPFTVSDIQGYVRRLKLPDYLDVHIEKDETAGIPLYSLYKKKENE